MTLCGLFIFNWMTLPAALRIDDASETQGIVELVPGKPGPRLAIHTQDFGEVTVDCFNAPALCDSPRWRSSEPVRVWLQWVGLAREPWIVRAESAAFGVANAEALGRAYRQHKAVLGWTSLLASCFLALLAWAGPYRSVREMTPSSTFLS